MTCTFCVFFLPWSEQFVSILQFSSILLLLLSSICGYKSITILHVDLCLLGFCFQTAVCRNLRSFTFALELHSVFSLTDFQIRSNPYLFWWDTADCLLLTSQGGLSSTLVSAVDYYLFHWVIFYNVSALSASFPVSWYLPSFSGMELMPIVLFHCFITSHGNHNLFLYLVLC